MEIYVIYDFQRPNGTNVIGPALKLRSAVEKDYMTYDKRLTGARLHVGIKPSTLTGDVSQPV